MLFQNSFIGTSLNYKRFGKAKHHFLKGENDVFSCVQIFIIHICSNHFLFIVYCPFDSQTIGGKGCGIVEVYLQLLFRTVFLYLLILIVFRLMGKREVGELSIMDIVVFVLIAECVAFAIEDVDKPLFQNVFPILLLLAIQYLNSLLALKSKKIRDLIDGDPSIIIKDGMINQEEMRKQRYNLDDLFQQMREERIASVQQIKYAFLEPSGKLSIFLKSDDPLIFPLIVDGYVVERHLQFIQKDKNWLIKNLKKKGFENTEDIFYCCYENNELHVQLKASTKKRA